MAYAALGAVPKASQALRTYLKTLLAKKFSTPAFTVGTETGGNSITVTCQLKDGLGNAVAVKTMVDVWISDAAASATVSATPPSGAVTFSTGGQLKEVTTKVLHKVITDASGIFAIAIVEAGAKSYYVNVAVGDVIASQVATWA